MITETDKKKIAELRYHRTEGSHPGLKDRTDGIETIGAQLWLTI
jgi:hypothetical protein